MSHNKWLVAGGSAPRQLTKNKKEHMERTKISRSRYRLAGVAAMALLAATAAVRADDAQKSASNELTPLELPTVVVIGVTPSSSLGLPLNKVPGNVQSSSSADIGRHDAANISDYMNQALGSVNINDNQNNPYQPDVTYRGFSASPLLGASIGMSVYQDGVRVNEPFGDIVNWDLIPKSAIANIELVPGSNPLFGLNTLGGALAVRTKSGFAFPGTSVQAYGGSYGRRAFEFEHGGSKGNFDWFATANIAHDDGWRPASTSNVHQAFGKIGWQNDITDIDLSYTFAENTLHGVQSTPLSQLKQSYTAVYTIPDHTTDLMHFLNLQVSHRLGGSWELSGNAYYRQNTIGTLNSNTGNTADTCSGFAGFNVKQCLNDAGNLINAYPGSNETTRSEQYSTGVSLQASSDAKLFDRDNNVAFGATYDYGHTRFIQEDQNGTISQARAIIGATPFVLTNDLIAVDLQGCLDSLAEIVGETTTEDILDVIFEQFCLGK